MNAGELKKILEGVPDSAPVGIADHFGYMEELLGATYHEPGAHLHQKNGWVELRVPFIGNEPD